MFKNVPSYSSFSVDDVPKAKEFYAQTLGLDVEQDDSMGMPMLHINLAGGARLMVYPKGDAHESANYTILNFVVDDIEKAVDELASKDVKFEQYDSEYVKTDAKGIARDEKGPGPSIAWFKDPAGNVLAVMQEK